MNYPLISEYIEAIKSAEDNFEELSYLRPVLGSDGLPIMSAGGFSIVFKMKDEQSGKSYALKCFTKEQEGRSESYKLIADELEYVPTSYLTPIRFFEKELFVDTDQTTETEFPVLLMDWVDGIPMDKYIQENINNQYALEMLTFRFSKLATWLLAQPFAHGDLKPDNILVKEDGSVVLVDYDGMYVPAMKGQKARELGSPNFRHPLRTEDVFDESIDDFSISLIFLSLKAFSLNKDLINDYCTNDFLLFKEKDYACISTCNAMKSVLNLIQDNELQSLLGAFMIVLANNCLSLVSSRLMMLKSPKLGKAYGENVYNQARHLCEAEDNSNIDYDKAFELFKKAAKIGNADAQCCVGCCYKNGYGTKMDYTEARFWYEKSSKNGCARALRHIAMCYEDGLGVEKDINTAIEWYKKAIERGDKTSMEIIGKIYYYGRGGVDVNFEEAVKWYKLAAENGEDDGMWRLAQCYGNGKGISKNLEKAYEWFKKSAEKDNRNGLFGVGQCYNFGYGVEKNYVEAVQYYMKAAEKGHIASLWHLGSCYELGQGVDKDFNKAIELYKKSAEKGNPEGQWRLGQCYRYARGVQRNIKEALFWYKKAAEQGHEKAKDAYDLLNNSMTEIYIDGCTHIRNKEYKEAYEIFHSISQDALGQNGLGICCANGYYVKQSIETAAYWFQKAARQGLAVAQYNLALCYYLGKGIRTDKVLASYWKGKAVEQGFTPAKVLESWERTPLYKSFGIESFNFENTLKNMDFLLKDDVL